MQCTKMLTFALCLAVIATAIPAWAADSAPSSQVVGPVTGKAVAHDVSPPLREMIQLPARQTGLNREVPLRVPQARPSRGSQLRESVPDPLPAADYPRAAARWAAASTNATKSGCGRNGVDLNSGWNWHATNQGWSASSTTSTRRPSGETPEQTSPARESRSRYSGLNS